MAQIKINTADEVVVPGKEEAQRKRKEAEKAAEDQANSLFAAPGQNEAERGPDYGYQRIRFHKRDEINPYADAEDARHALDPRAVKIIVLVIVMLAVGFVITIMPTDIFSVERGDHSIGKLASEVATSFQGIIATLMGQESLFTYYVMSVFATIVAGAALGLSGGVYQGALKNALASPSTLGVMSGGTLGLIVYAVFLYPYTVTDFVGTVSEYENVLAQMNPFELFVTYYGGFACALIGCFVVVFIVMIMAMIAGRGHLSNASLIIAGQVFTAVITVVITWMRTYLTLYGTEEQIELLTTSQSASFTGTYSVPVTLCFAIPVFICMAIIFGMSSRLSILAFKDEEARSMGISTTRTRNLMVALCTIMTALVISFCGPIGFVGFIVPHVARNFVGPDFRYLLPACACIGAILVSVVNALTNLGIPGFVSGGTGMYTSIIGCIMFVVMALRQRGSSNGDWF